MLILLTLFLILLAAYLIHVFYALEILPNKEVIDHSIRTLCTTLSKEELARFNDYSCSVNLGRWYISPDITATEVAKDMCAYYGITPTNLYVGFSDTYKSSAGALHHVDDNYLIEIDISLIQNHAKVLAILAHEVTHMFLFSKGITLPNTRENELLTDTCAAFFGFASILLDHYTEERSSKVIEQTADYKIVRHSTTKLGYLDIDELAYIIAMRNYYFQSSSSLRNVIDEADDAMKDSPQLVIRGYQAFRNILRKAPHRSAPFWQRWHFKQKKRNFQKNALSEIEGSSFTLRDRNNPILYFACPICNSQVTTPLVDGEAQLECSHCNVTIPYTI